VCPHFAVEALSPNGVLLEYPWEKGDDEADTNTPSELTNPTPEDNAEPQHWPT